MIKANPLLYVPALRAKTGEVRGLQRLASDIASKITPHLIVPPPKDIDPEKQRPLTQDEILYGTGKRIADHWRLRDAFLDTRYLFKEFGEDTSADWLNRIFSVARYAGANLIPVLTLGDALGPRQAAFRSVLHPGPIHAALRIKFDEVDGDLPAHLASALSAMGLTDQRCVILADFSEADFAAPDVVGEIAQGVLEDLQAIGRWPAVVFQGSNYPVKNPADDNGSCKVARNEWLAWKAAVDLNGASPDKLVFGDYAADCSKIEFKKKSGGIPIRHYRYALTDSWLVVRGIPTGETKSAMQQVCAKIINSGSFAGREFSAADDFIYRCAQGWDGPGNGTTWREVNTTHHITRVVRDIGGVKGYAFSDRQVSTPTYQPSIFDLVR